jgi:hypothetical protein
MIDHTSPNRNYPQHSYYQDLKSLSRALPQWLSPLQSWHLRRTCGLLQNCGISFLTMTTWSFASPLLESKHCDITIFANNSTAIPITLGALGTGKREEKPIDRRADNLPGEKDELRQKLSAAKRKSEGLQQWKSKGILKSQIQVCSQWSIRSNQIAGHMNSIASP